MPDFLRQLGVKSCIQKPVDFSDFRDTVRQLGLYWLLINVASPTGAFVGVAGDTSNS